jgi:hypothetical protein
MSQSTITQKLITISIAIIIFAGIIIAMDSALATPIVQVSDSTKECVNVINFESTFFTDEEVYTCESLPTKYTHEWVR